MTKLTAANEVPLPHDLACATSIRVRELLAAGEPAEPDPTLLHHIAHTIHEHCGHPPLKAHRLAWGWTPKQATAALDALSDQHRLPKRGITQRSWHQWEAGTYRPDDDYLDRIARLFHTNIIKLGYATDHVPRSKAGRGLAASRDYVVPVTRDEQRHAPGPGGLRIPSDHASWTSHGHDAEGGGSVRRRDMISAIAGVPPMLAFEAFRADPVSAADMEALRHDLMSALGASMNVDDWEEIAWSYGRAYGDTPPRLLLEDLRVDLIVAHAQLDAAPDERVQRSLQRVIALLAVFTAQSYGNLADHRSVRWWRTARAYADASRDAEARVWVRGREVIRGIYERRPLVPLLQLADEAEQISPKPGMGTCSALAGRAQVFAMLERSDEATAALGRVHEAAGRLPDHIASDTVSMYGWPEYRLRHTESYVWTYLDDHRRAEAAHDRALELYSPAMFRERAQVEMHRAVRLVRAGNAVGGADHAHRILQSLPSGQRIAAVLELARVVTDSAPVAERTRPEVAGLQEMLALPVGS